MVKKIKITFPLASAMPIMYCHFTLVLSLFSFLFALKKYTQKKTCSAPTSKELICKRSHLIDSISRAALSAFNQAHFAFSFIYYFQGIQKQKELDFSTCQAKAELI